jgi:hypothetical protein
VFSAVVQRLGACDKPSPGRIPGRLEAGARTFSSRLYVINDRQFMAHLAIPRWLPWENGRVVEVGLRPDPRTSATLNGVLTL